MSVFHQPDNGHRGFSRACRLRVNSRRSQDGRPLRRPYSISKERTASATGIAPSPMTKTLNQISLAMPEYNAATCGRMQDSYRQPGTRSELGLRLGQKLTFQKGLRQSACPRKQTPEPFPSRQLRKRPVLDGIIIGFSTNVTFMCRQLAGGTPTSRRNAPKVSSRSCLYMQLAARCFWDRNRFDAGHIGSWKRC